MNNFQGFNNVAVNKKLLTMSNELEMNFTEEDYTDLFEKDKQSLTSEDFKVTLITEFVFCVESRVFILPHSKINRTRYMVAWPNCIHKFRLPVLYCIKIKNDLFLSLKYVFINRVF